MDAKEFAQGYPRREVNPSDRGDNETYLQAEAYSEFFGTILHDALTGELDPNIGVANFMDVLTEYGQFVRGEMADYERKLFMSGKEYANKRLNSFSYHWLNTAMALMWEFVINPELAKDERTRKEIIGMTQDLIALGGSKRFTYKDRLADKKNGYMYFGESMEATRAVLEGSLQEFDTAIVLLDIAKKHPGTIVLPAPAQFEQWAATTETGNRNVDLLLIDLVGNRAIGVQVKAFANGDYDESQVLGYDSNYAVVVDGNVDLQNRQHRRVKQEKTQFKSVSWAGMISADHLKNLNTHGNRASKLLGSVSASTLLQLKFDAKTRLGATKVNRQQLIQNIEPRVIAKL